MSNGSEYWSVEEAEQQVEIQAAAQCDIANRVNGGGRSREYLSEYL